MCVNENLESNIYLMADYVRKGAYWTDRDHLTTMAQYERLQAEDAPDLEFRCTCNLRRIKLLGCY